MQIRLLAPAIWQPLLSEIQMEEHGRTAQLILENMHRRHVGITPALAVDLAALLRDRPGRPNPQEPWGAVFDRLTQTITDPMRRKDSRASAKLLRNQEGFLLRSSPAFVLFRLAQPLTEIACRYLGETVLFCGDDVGADVSATQYADYDERLRDQIISLAKEQDDTLDVFWYECALSLATYSSRRAGGPRQQDGELPALDPSGLGLLMRLEPGLRAGRQTPRLIRRPSPVKQFTSKREREGGFDGIRISRRLEDIDDMLLSEWLNDEVTRADRMINTGYFVFEREPKQVKLRDVLVVGWLPEPLAHRLPRIKGQEPSPPPGTFWMDFVKACWFETLARFGLILLRNDLRLSEFRWIEADGLARSRQASFLLTDLNIASHMAGGNFSPEFRYTFLNALSWLPNFLHDRNYDVVEPRSRGPAMEVEGEEATTADEPAAHRQAWRPSDGIAAWRQGLQRWTDDVWRGQVEAEGWSAQTLGVEHHGDQPVRAKRRGKAARLAVEEFSVVHHMLVLPAARRDALQVANVAPREILNQLYGRMAPAQATAGGVSILWAPADLDNGEWVFEARGRSQPEWYRVFGEDHTAEKLSGWVVDTWLDHLIDEVRRG